MEFIDRYFRQPSKSFFLFGPRGTGKSTFVHKHFSDALTIDLLDPERVRALSADLRGLRFFKEEYPESKTLLLYRGKDRMLKGDVLCMPCEEFLIRLHPGRAMGEV